jgi:hypothetical protein
LLGGLLSGYSPAGAEGLDDYLQQGFTIARTTRLQGQFNGCVRSEELRFEDGSVFRCDQTRPHKSVNPRVLFLREGDDPPSVLIIGALSYDGAITVLHGKKLSEYLYMGGGASPVNSAPGHGAGAPGLIEPLRGIDSINQLQDSEPTILNHAQSEDVERNPADETDAARGH